MVNGQWSIVNSSIIGVEEVTLNKKKTSRFDDLIDAARSRQLRDKLPFIEDKSTSRSKSTDPDYTRTTLYLPKQLHRQLKAAAVAQERQMSDIVTELIEQWLIIQSGAGK